MRLYGCCIGINYAILELKNEFDFEIDEDYIFDRRELPWANNIEELNEIWRKRVKNDMLNLLLTGKEKTEIKDTLKKRYQRIYTNTFQLNSNDIFQSFVNAYTTSIEPHTSYFSPRTSENFDISMRLSLEGIGAVLRNENDYTLIQKIVPTGLSKMKIMYIKDLSKKIQSKQLNMRIISTKSDEYIIEHLTNVKGIGRWTAEMFLIFSLGRLDVLPVGDLGLKKGIQLMYSLKELPNEKEIEQIAESWKPYRTVATWYLWKSLQKFDTIG